MDKSRKNDTPEASPAETEERARLENCLAVIDDHLRVFDTRLDAYTRDIKESKAYLWEARHDMDHIEKIAVRQTIEQKMRSGDVTREQHRKLLKLRGSPYFGRFDFIRETHDDADAEIIYVGVHDFQDDASNTPLIHDWRAPISSLFYDHETGPAHYQAPAGEVRGRLERKRQFRIRDGRIAFMLESSVNIVDDVLQETLSQSSDEGMKNIVATIQRDQNAIIRDAEVHTLIIQGVAGSGKTSIALHRIAFLLYRFKDTLTSNDILIISPNRVFSDYIGNVLPELGEEHIGEVAMDTLAEEFLNHKYRFQTFFEQTTRLLETNDETMKTRIAAKASLDFLKHIDAYVTHLEASSFNAASWQTGRCIVPDWFFAEKWRKHGTLPAAKRIAQVMDAAEHQIGIHYNHDLRTDERRALRKAVHAMTRKITLRDAYKGLFVWLNKPDWFKPAGSKLEYSDVFPFIYLKLKLEGVENSRKEIKHLLIDEMQDYTPVHYAVLGTLFPCRKTILGDAMQSVNPIGASTAEQIQQALRATTPVKLTKSYRSTLEIMQFALAILPNADLMPMERHGAPPQVLVCARPADMVTQLVAEIEIFRAASHQNLAIIVKTQKKAKQLHQQLLKTGVETRLLDPNSTAFSTGIILCTIHLAKGLEFDHVIVPDANAETYHTAMDRNLLYIACTRAMHRLTMIAQGTPSNLLPAPNTE